MDTHTSISTSLARPFTAALTSSSLSGPNFSRYHSSLSEILSSGKEGWRRKGRCSTLIVSWSSAALPLMAFWSSRSPM